MDDHADICQLLRQSKSSIRQGSDAHKQYNCNLVVNHLCILLELQAQDLIRTGGHPLGA